MALPGALLVARGRPAPTGDHGALIGLAIGALRWPRAVGW